MRLLAMIAFLLAVFVAGAPVFAQRQYATPPRLEELNEEQLELMKKAMSLAMPLSEERITYHYGKPAPCEKLVAAQKYTGELYDKYSRLSERGGAVAGHGVYIAGNPHSSLDFFSGGGLQAVISQGTPMIDLTDPVTQARMNELGLTRSDIYNLPLDAVVRYNAKDDWLVIKGSSGIRFEPIDFSRFDDANLHDFLDAIRNRRAFGSEMSREFRTPLLERINAPSPDRGRIATLWFDSDRRTDLTRFGELSAETRSAALDSMKANGKLADFYGKFPHDLSEPDIAAAARLAYGYLDSLPEDEKRRQLALILRDRYEFLTRFNLLSASARKSALNELLASGRLESVVADLGYRSREAEGVAFLADLMDFLKDGGPEKRRILSAYVMQNSYQARDRFLALAPELRPQALVAALENAPFSLQQDVLKSRYFDPQAEVDILNSFKAEIKAGLAPRFASGAVREPTDVKALLLLSTLDQGKWLRDWELQTWVNALTPGERKSLEGSLGEILREIESGDGSKSALSKGDFSSIGRIISALNGGAAKTRAPSATGEARALKGRYLDLLESKFGVSKPALPALSRSAFADSCRTAMNRTLVGLGIASPMIVGVGTNVAFHFWNVSRKAEARQAIQSLCEGEGGSYLLSADGGPGGCRCGVGREITWDWDSLGKRDPQARICAP